MEDQKQEMSHLERMAMFLQSHNIAEMLEEEELNRMVEECRVGYEIDHESQKDWRDRMEDGLKLAELVKDKEQKTYPFKNAADVRYPLITSATLQFNARAYPAIVPPDGAVKAKVLGNDQSGEKAARGERVSAYMSWQLMSEVEEWEETTDKILTTLPIVGTVFRKWWFDDSAGRMRCRMVIPGKLVINDKVKSFSDAPRVTEELPLFPDEISRRKRTGTFRDIDYLDGNDIDPKAEQIFLEQQCRYDLDGDGYEEPYIVTWHKESRKVARIVADFDVEDVHADAEGNVTSIKSGTYFIPYHFLPAMSGGFLGTGFGLLLGDISATVNSIINMMMDAGHMASRGGGFIGSDFRIKGGANRFEPGEWKKANARGADIKNAIVPLTFPGADATLFQLMGVLVDAAKEVSSVSDVITGDTGGRAMTATTTLALIEQGMMVFTAAYKRIFRSLKQEFRLIAKMNARAVDPRQYSMFHDMIDPNGQPVMIDPAQEFGLAGMDIEPVADPRSVTKMQEAAKAEMLMQLARDGMIDPMAAGMRALEAMSIPDVEELMPQPDPLGPLKQKVAEAEATLKMIEVEQALADIEKTRSETVKNMTDAAAQDAKLRLDRAQMALEAIRDGLQQSLSGGLGQMAGIAADADGYGNAPPFGGGAEVAGNVRLLGGQPLDRSGQVGLAPAGINIGGLG